MATVTMKAPAPAGLSNKARELMEEINAEAEKLLQAWGGTSQLTACTVQGPARPFAGNQNAN